MAHKASKIIPFEFWPYTWGMTGKTREIAKAEYELSGYELDVRLAKLTYSGKELEKTLHFIDFRYGKISDLEYGINLANLIEDETERNITLLEIKYADKQISDFEYKKTLATLRKEPWVTVVSMSIADSSSKEGSFELDWNDFFIKKLRNEGYKGKTDEDVANIWFMELCRNVALEEFDGVGNFTTDSEDNLETMKRINEEAEQLSQHGRRAYR